MAKTRIPMHTGPYGAQTDEVLRGSVGDLNSLAALLESDPKLSKMFRLDDARVQNQMSLEQINKLFSQMDKKTRKKVQKKAKGGPVHDISDMIEADEKETLPERMKKWAQGEEGTEYAEILPIARKGEKLKFAAPKAVRHVARGTADLLEGARGKLPVGQNISPEAVDALMSMSVPGLLTKDRGTLGMFAGTRAKTANLKNLKLAQGFEKSGAPAEDIWNLTGWMRGKDGKWRFEIPDDEMKFVKPEMQRIANPAEGTAPASSLDKLVEHQKLFEAYPELKETVMMADPQLTYGAGEYNPNINAITMSRKDITPNGGYFNLRGGNVPLHEMQHKVQEIEGFNPGSNMETYLSESVPESAAYDMYRRNLGEVEARNTEARRRLNVLQRKNSYPEWTQDVKSKDVITDTTKLAKGGLVLSRSKKFVKKIDPIKKEHYRQSLGVGALTKVRTKVRKPFK